MNHQTSDIHDLKNNKDQLLGAFVGLKYEFINMENSNKILKNRKMYSEGIS